MEGVIADRAVDTYEESLLQAGGRSLSLPSASAQTDALLTGRLALVRAAAAPVQQAANERWPPCVGAETATAQPMWRPLGRRNASSPPSART